MDGTQAIDRILPRLADIVCYKRTVARSGLIGAFMRPLPGVGEDMGAWMSSAAARRAMTLSEVSLVLFFTRPISAVLAIACVLMLLGPTPAVRRGARTLWSRMRGKTEGNN